MEIRKRNGESVPFQQEKIFNAMKKAFDGQGKGDRGAESWMRSSPPFSTISPSQCRSPWNVCRTRWSERSWSADTMRWPRRTSSTAKSGLRCAVSDIPSRGRWGDDSLDEVLRRIQMDFTEEVYSLAALQMKFESFCRPGMTEDERAEALTKAAVELTTAEAPKWEFIAARLLNHSFRCRNAQEWEGRGVGDLYGRLRYLTDKGLYGDYILAHYTHEEIAMAEDFLCPERDELFTYSGLDLLLKRYVIQSCSRVPLETPQEMFFGHRAASCYERRL